MQITKCITVEAIEKAVFECVDIMQELLSVTERQAVRGKFNDIILSRCTEPQPDDTQKELEETQQELADTKKKLEIIEDRLKYKVMEDLPEYLLKATGDNIQVEDTHLSCRDKILALFNWPDIDPMDKKGRYGSTEKYIDNILVDCFPVQPAPTSDRVHRECAEELGKAISSLIEERVQNTRHYTTESVFATEEGYRNHFNNILARHFPNHNAMKEALENLLDKTSFIVGLYNNERCGYCKISYRIRLRSKTREQLPHKDDCVIKQARTALGLEGK